MGYSLSVIVPAYNSIKTLPETLTCLLGQSLYEKMQIIVVNDGSDDGTSEYVRKLQNNHHNIKLIEKSNGGVSSARNCGIEAAEGKYLVFCDADDLIGKDSAENIVNEMEKVGADIGIFRIARFGFGGFEYNPIVDSLAKDSIIRCSDKRLLWTFLVSNKCYRTEIIKRSGIRFPDTCYCEDGVFWMSVVLKTEPRIIGIRNASALYRRSDPDITKTVTQTVTMKTAANFVTSMEIIDRVINEYLSSEACNLQDKNDYLQEFTYKKCYTILNEFYRQIWHSDNDTMTFLGNKFRLLYNSLNDDYTRKLKFSFRELWTPVFGIPELADNPLINIVVNKPSDVFLNSLYHQTMPGFFIVTKEKCNTGFNNIGLSPKAGITVTFKGKHPVDSRILRIIYLNKTSGKLSVFPSVIIKHISYIYIRIKDKKQKVSS